MKTTEQIQAQIHAQQLERRHQEIESLMDRNAALTARVQTLEDALRRLANFEGEPIWDDSRDDAANQMVSIAQEALNPPTNEN